MAGLDEIAIVYGVNQELLDEADFYLEELESDGAFEGMGVSIPISIWKDLDSSKPEKSNRIFRYIISEVGSTHLPRVLGNSTLRRAYFSLFDGKPEPLAKIMKGLDLDDKLYNNLAHQRLTTRS